MKVILIHNPKAGMGNKPSRKRLLAAIRRAGHAPIYQSSKARHWKRVLKKPADIIAVAGGDGTVDKVSRQLRKRSIPVAILPIGTANNIAKTLGLTNRSLEELIDGWRTAAHARFDIGTATGPWGSTPFSEGVGVGFLADTVHHLDTTGQIDPPLSHDPDETTVASLRLFKQRLQSYPATKVKIRLDGRDISGDYVLVEAMNIKYVGPNLCLAPHADPGDGLLDVVLVSPTEQHKLSGYLSGRMKRRRSRPSLRVRRGRYLQIKVKGGVVHIDDETWPRRSKSFLGSPAAIKVKASTYTVDFLVPAKANVTKVNRSSAKPTR
jgi:diacylglycerol kinase (ATP)